MEIKYNVNEENDVDDGVNHKQTHGLLLYVIVLGRSENIWIYRHLNVQFLTKCLMCCQLLPIEGQVAGHNYNCVKCEGQDHPVPSFLKYLAFR